MGMDAAIWFTMNEEFDFLFSLYLEKHFKSESTFHSIRL